MIVIWSMRRLLIAEKPNTLMNFTIKGVLYGTIAARLAGLMNVVNTITGQGTLFYRKDPKILFFRMLVSIAFWAFLRSSVVVFQNVDDQREFHRKGFSTPNRSFLVKGSGVDTDVFHYTPEPSGPPVVLMASRMLIDKGIENFVGAAKALRRRSPLVRFVIVGDLASNNTNAVKLEKLNDWIRKGWIEWWGWQENMPKVYAQANIVCLPALYREGLPKSLTEAAACGRALIASDIPGCREIVRPNINGFLISPDDTVGLIKAIEDLISDDILRYTMGRKGREIAELEYSVDSINKSYLSILND